MLEVAFKEDTHRVTQNKVVQPGIRRHQEEEEEMLTRNKRERQ